MVIRSQKLQGMETLNHSTRQTLLIPGHELSLLKYLDASRGLVLYFLGGTGIRQKMEIILGLTNSFVLRIL